MLGGLAVLLLWVVVGAARASAEELVQLPITVMANSTFTVQIQVGTPGQMLSADLDFGSADISLINSPSLCGDATCTTFNGSRSQSMVFTNFFVDSVLYSDSTPVSGYFIEDTVQMGTARIDNASILIRNASSLSQLDYSVSYSSFQPGAYANTLGLGPRGLQMGTMWLDDNGVPGPLYLGYMYQLRGLTPSFSVWIDPSTLRTGLVTFGGVDRALFQPDSLVSMPIVSIPNAPALEAENVTALSEPIYLGLAYQDVSIEYISSAGTEVSTELTFVPSLIILNSRSDFAAPPTLIHSVGPLLGGVWSVLYENYLMVCSVDASLRFNLSGFVITASVKDLLAPINVADAAGRPICVLTIDFADQIYLSNKILQRYFIAVNYATHEISFARPRSPNGAPPDFVPMSASRTSATAPPTNPAADDPPAYFSFLTRSDAPDGAPRATFAPSQSTSLGLQTTSISRNAYAF